MTRKPSLVAIFLTIFVDLIGFSLVIPFLAEEARDTFGTPEIVATLLGSVYSLMQFIFVPVWGRLSDRVGRRPVLVWSVAATALSMTGLGVALTWGGSVVWLFVARIASGIATANIGTASAYIADITKPEDRARGMGLIGAAFGLGFILGPGIGGVLADIPVNGRHGPVACFAAAALALANLAWVTLGLPESLPAEARAAAPKRRLVPLDLEALRETLALPEIGMAIAVNFIILLSFTNLDQTFRFFTKDMFGMRPAETGLVLAFIGVVAAGVQGGAIRPLSRRFGEAKLIRAGVALQLAAFVTLGLSPRIGLAGLLVAGALLAVGNGLSQPAIGAFISKRAPATAQGGTLGTNQSVASLARMFGPATGGVLYSVGPSAPYFVAAAVMALAYLLAARLRAKEGAPAG